MQRSLGACSEDDIAPRVLTRVVGHYPRASGSASGVGSGGHDMILVDLGWSGISAQGAEEGYGRVETGGENDKRQGLRIAALKQECGEIEAADGGRIKFDDFPIGSLLAISPFHSCASTKMHDAAAVVEEWEGERAEDCKCAKVQISPWTSEALGELEVVESWKICRGW